MVGFFLSSNLLMGCEKNFQEIDHSLRKLDRDLEILKEQFF